MYVDLSLVYSPQVIITWVNFKMAVITAREKQFLLPINANMRGEFYSIQIV